MYRAHTADTTSRETSLGPEYRPVRPDTGGAGGGQNIGVKYNIYIYIYICVRGWREQNIGVKYNIIYIYIYVYTANTTSGDTSLGPEYRPDTGGAGKNRI